MKGTRLRGVVEVNRRNPYHINHKSILALDIDPISCTHLLNRSFPGLGLVSGAAINWGHQVAYRVNGREVRSFPD
jgi:hypothetical protein